MNSAFLTAENLHTQSSFVETLDDQGHYAFITDAFSLEVDAQRGDPGSLLYKKTGKGTAVAMGILTAVMENPPKAVASTSVR